MKKNKYLFVLCMLLAIALASGIFTMAYMNLEDSSENRETLRVVTSFYPVYIAALNVVGDSESVILENLSEPQTGCLHDYQLTPQDMILLSKADLFLINGGGIESFLAEVGKAYPNLTVAEATEGLTLLKETEGEQKETHGQDATYAQEENHEEEGHVHGEGQKTYAGENHEEEGHVHGNENENAHGWMDTTLYVKMVENIADALSRADQEHAELYQENAGTYCKKIDGLTSQIEEIKATVLENQTSEQNENVLSNAGLPEINVVIFHEAYAYVAKQYGLQVAYCLNLDEERQVSAREVADVMHEMNENQVSVILAEELYGKDMGNTVEAETDGKVYYLDSLVRGEYDADSYLAAMQKNIDIMKAALEEIK